MNPDHEFCAKDVLTMAANGGMPESFWYTDERIARAALVLGWSPMECYHWAQGWIKGP